MKEIRLGTIGSGPIVHTILDAVKETKGVQCTAVYSRSKEKGRRLAEAYQAEKVYTNLEDMFMDKEINFIYIASPNILHYEQTKMALLAGKNVICEKPFCTRAEQVRELAGIAREKGLFLVDAVPTTYLPNYEILKRELKKIGRIRLVLSSYSQYSSRYDQLLMGEVPNVFNPEFAGGCLMDINFYNLYLNIALFGEPKEAVYYPNIYKNLADTSGILTLAYEDFVSECAGAKDTWGVNSVQIQGEKGYLYVKDGSNGFSEIRTVTRDGEEVFNEQGETDRRFFEVQNVTKLILSEDRQALWDRLALTEKAIRVLEEARTKAGLFFPGDQGWK